MSDLKHLGLPKDDEPTLIQLCASIGLFAMLAVLPFAREILSAI
jgi:hypothetical protein